MLAVSAQKRSGTRNRRLPSAYRLKSCSACSVSGSRTAGRNHLAATLASITSVVTGRDPRAASVRSPENSPRKAQTGFADAGLDGERASWLSARPESPDFVGGEPILRQRLTSDAAAPVPAMHRINLRECF